MRLIVTDRGAVSVRSVSHPTTRHSPLMRRLSEYLRTPRPCSLADVLRLRSGSRVQQAHWLLPARLTTGRVGVGHLGEYGQTRRSQGSDVTETKADRRIILRCFVKDFIGKGLIQTIQKRTRHVSLSRLNRPRSNRSRTSPYSSKKSVSLQMTR